MIYARMYRPDSPTHVYLCPNATLCGAPSTEKTNRAGGIADCAQCRERLVEIEAKQFAADGYFLSAPQKEASPC